MKIRIYPDHSNLPIGPAMGRVGSAMPLAIVGVPSGATAVSIAITNADGTAYTAAATREGGEWLAVVPASHFASYGAISRGMKVSVTFRDATDTSQTVLFLGDVRIEQADAGDPSGTGTASVPVTEVAEVAAGSTMKDIRDKVNEIARIVSGTATALMLAFCAFGASPLEEIPGTNLVYTAAETDAAIVRLAPPGITTNDVCNIVTNETGGFSPWSFSTNGVEFASGIVWRYRVIESAPEDSGFITEEIRLPDGTMVYFSDGTIKIADDATEFTAGVNFVAPVEDAEWEFTTVTATRTFSPYRNALDLARLSDLNGLASAASVAAANSRAANAQNAANAASNTAANVAGTVAAWETYWDGDEVRVTVTNYYGSQDIPALYIEEKNQNTNTYKVVWDERTRWRTNAVEMAELRSAIDQKADRAWGYYDSTTGEWAPDGFTWISSPKIAIAGGLAYQRTLTTAGAIWVLTSNGMVAQTGGDVTNGFFRIRDDEGNTTFEIVRGNKRTVGATASGIKVTSPRNSPTVTIEIPYNVVSEVSPTLYGTASLSDPDWTEIEATWLGQSGAWTAIVTTASSQYFVKGEYETGGETYIRNAAPISAESGIYCTDGIHKVRPVYNNGTITWEVVQ